MTSADSTKDVIVEAEAKGVCAKKALEVVVEDEIEIEDGYGKWERRDGGGGAMRERTRSRISILFLPSSSNSMQ